MNFNLKITLCFVLVVIGCNVMVSWHLHRENQALRADIAQFQSDWNQLNVEYVEKLRSNPENYKLCQTQFVSCE